MNDDIIQPVTCTDIAMTSTEVDKKVGEGKVKDIAFETELVDVNGKSSLRKNHFDETNDNDCQLIPKDFDPNTGEHKMTGSASNEDPIYDLLYGVDESPSWYATLAFSMQQLLLSVSGIITSPLVMLPILCADDSASVNEYRTSMIGTCMFVSGVVTFIQTTFGVRLPIIQGTAASYMISVIAVVSTDNLKCPVALNTTSNSTDESVLIYNNSNSSTFIRDVYTNQTIEVFPDSNYYRDNDGIIRDSNQVWLLRLNEIQGGIICCSILQMFIGFGGLMGFLIRFIGPLTIAPTLIMISFGLLPIALNMSSNQWGIAIFIVAIFFISAVCMDKVLVPILSCNRKGKRVNFKVKSRMPVFSMFPGLLAILFGWLLCYIVTVTGGFSDDPNDPSYGARTDTRPDATHLSPWFRFPYPFQFGWPTFTTSTILGMLAAVLPGILESFGDYNAAALISNEPSPPHHAVNRGVVMEGIGLLLSGMLGTANATTSWSNNVIMVGISRVASRRVFQYTAVLLVMLGCFTKFLSMFSTLPPVVLGGSMCAISGMIFSIGVSTLKHVDMRLTRNLFILGLSVSLGIILPEYIKNSPNGINIEVKEVKNIIDVLLRSPMFIAGIIGFTLDNIAPGSRESRGLTTFHKKVTNDTNGKSTKVYQLPFNTNWSWAKYVPVCPNFRTK